MTKGEDEQQQSDPWEKPTVVNLSKEKVVQTIKNDKKNLPCTCDFKL